MRKLLATGAFAAASIGFMVNPAGAATQNGLVNVNLEGIDVQAPIGVAANVCDVAANVLARQIGDGPAECTSTADPDAIMMSSPRGSSTKQEGLVNVNVENLRVQVPIAVAANICDVDVNVLSLSLLNGPATCEAIADSNATN